MKFTEEQKRVIEARGRNILVSAAAGSGKTAVLVERIIRMILDPDNPIEIDRLLVVTFTEAAALEMRERIGQAIQQRLELDPMNEHLQRQSALLYKAQISTIHSFCLNVIRNNFNEIGLDPAFRVGDSTELKLLKEDTLESLFEEQYESKHESFVELVRYFGKGVSDSELKEALFDLSDFAEGYPWPEEWLEDCLEMYELKAESFDDLPWVQYLLAYIRCRLTDVKEQIILAKEYLNSPLSPACYEQIVEKDLKYVDLLLKTSSYDELRENLTIGFDRLPNAPKGTDPELKEGFKSIREDYKKIIFDTQKSASIKNLLQFTKDEALSAVAKMAPVVRSLVELTRTFIDRFKAQRISKGIISFSDMEHYALNILYSTDDKGQRVLSKTAYDYRDAFDEILMDEYQDCNRVQEEIMKAIADEQCIKNDRFMVGDVKQSIYKFRLANPNLFIEKYNCYQFDDQIGHDDDPCEKIVLHKNFRSRLSVIDSVNNLFGQIMKEDFGGVEYDKDAALVYGADYPKYQTEEMKAMSRAEFLLTGINNESDFNKLEQEAQLVAERIKELRDEFKVTEKETKEFRPVRYQDIVILMRSLTSSAQVFKEVLEREGIPVHVSLSVGFYDTPEVQQLLQFLRIIDNPRQDIALFGVLRGFFGGFSDEEIACLRAGSKEQPLIEALRDRTREPKVASFLEMLEEYRRKSSYYPIHQLIEEIINESGYLQYETALPGGNQRRANLLLLISKAAGFEKTSYKGLFNFLRYVSRMKRVESEEGEAEVLGENDDVVRIMTIHKSKGLEFPICFLSCAQHNFNMADLKKNVMTDMELGIGINHIDLKRHIQKTPLLRKVIGLKLKQDMLGEELRVLYVAMTRAKEKLIITGSVDENKFIKQKEKLGLLLRQTDRVPFGILADASSYLDMLAPMYDEAKIILWDELESRVYKRVYEETLSKEQFLKCCNEMPEDDEELVKLVNQGKKRYAHPELEGMILKTSVSELKKQYLDTEFSESLFEAPVDEDASRDEYLPKFLKKSEVKISGADRGSAYHKVMELLDFDNEDIKSQIDLFVEQQLLPKEWAEAVNIKKIQGFIKSNLAVRMARADANGLLKREQPFVLGMEANRVKPEYPKEETVLLQGIIDAFFIEDGEIVLIDYKTDVIKTADELAKRYHVQIEYYKEALERILGMRVKEAILYSFALQEEVVI